MTIELTKRQRVELDSLTTYPPVAIDEEAAQELTDLGLVSPCQKCPCRTPHYRFTDAGRALLSVERRRVLDETEKVSHERPPWRASRAP